MKMKIKKLISHIMYCIKAKGYIMIYSIDDTIDTLINTDNSLVRFGDGEITLIRGINNSTQTTDSELGQRLSDILGFQEEKLLVALPDIFQGLEQYRDSGKRFWEDHLLKGRKCYYRYCNKNRIYYNSFISRCYYLYLDKSNCGQYFQKIRQIWYGKDIIIVEGEKTHNGVGNNLMDTARSIQRVLCPSTDAYFRYQEILQACLGYDNTKLFLLSIGAAAKPLAYDLYLAGYRVIDIGNLDLEYEWYLQKAQDKVTLGKYEVVGIQANIAAGFDQYVRQIEHTIK